MGAYFVCRSGEWKIEGEKRATPQTTIGTQNQMASVLEATERLLKSFELYRNR